MSDRILAFCSSMQDQLQELQERSNQLMTRLMAAPEQVQESVCKKINQAEPKVDSRERSFDKARSSMWDWLAQRKAQAKTTIEHLKASYEAKRLLRRADLAEDYAIAAILVAESSIEEVEQAVSEAIAADLAAAAIVSS